MSDDQEVVYCPSHLAIHETSWCTTNDHIPMGTKVAEEALAEARRRGYCFFHGDVISPRDSAKDPRVGDVVGDRRAKLSRGCGYHRSYLREVVAVDEKQVTWCHPRRKGLSFVCSRKTWNQWATGSERVSPEDGHPVASRGRRRTQ